MGLIINTLKNYQYRHLNIRLVIWVIGLTVLGVNVIASATDSSSFEKRQVVGMALGIFVMLVIGMISYRFILRFYWVLYTIYLILLIWVKVAGASRKGATRWISFGGTQLQPSEFTKIFLIIFFAMFLYKYRERINTLPVLAGTVVLFLVPLLLVLAARPFYEYSNNSYFLYNSILCGD